MTVSLMMMFGRTGSIFGNLLFPQLLSLGCHPPFLTMAAILVCELEIVHYLFEEEAASNSSPFIQY